MINLETTFNEFIQYIPICKETHNLGVVVSEICNSPQGMVAVVDDDDAPQGIIYSHLLVETLAKEQFKNRQNATDCPKYLLEKVKLPLDSLFGNSKITEFLADFSLASKQQNRDYFIVDEAGKLLGILNTSQFLKELFASQITTENQLQPSVRNPLASILDRTIERRRVAFKKEQTQIKAENPPNSLVKVKKIPANTTEFKAANPHLYYLLTQIPFPLIIENNRGEVCYLNSHWKREIESERESKNSASLVHCSNLNSRSNSRTNIPPKITTLETNRFPLKKTNSLNLTKEVKENYFDNFHCPTVNNLPLVSLSNKTLREQTNQLELSSFNRSSAQRVESADVSSVKEGYSRQAPASYYKGLPSPHMGCGIFEDEGVATKQIVSDSTVEAKSRENHVTFEVDDDSWCYYQLPLKIDRDCLKLAEHSNYWLTLATKLPLFNSPTNYNYLVRQQTKLRELQDEFILNISHDLKSPLTAIIGLSSLLKEEKLGSLNSSQLRYSKMIYYSSKRLINIINDLLDLTRITAGKLKLNLESIELDTTCQKIYDGVVQKLTAIAAAKEDSDSLFPNLQLDISSDAQKAIADRTYFAQILTRFFENALELVDSQQVLGIVTERWSDWLAVTVWHQGEELSPAQQNFSELKFSPYTNLLSSQQTKQELGLALARELAKAHGGDISVITQINYGNEFTLLLPINGSCNLSKAEALGDSLDAETAMNSSDNQKQNSLVLIVATSSTKIAELNKQLKAIGYHCAIARDRKEALYKARCFQPYKIILEIERQQNTICDLVETLKNDSQTRQIPLIGISQNQLREQYPARKGRGLGSLRQNREEQTRLESKPIESNLGENNNLEEFIAEFIDFPLNKAHLTNIFTPLHTEKVPKKATKQHLVVLRLSIVEKIDLPQEHSVLDSIFENISFSLSHHIIEADSLEQAYLLARIWDVDVIIWDGATLESPETCLDSFAESNILASIPLITLDTKSTEVANKISNLIVFPCLLPPNERSIIQLTQVIQIAAGLA